MTYTAQATIGMDREVFRKGTNKNRLRSLFLFEIKGMIASGDAGLVSWTIMDENGREVYNGYVNGLR